MLDTFLRILELRNGSRGIEQTVEVMAGLARDAQFDVVVRSTALAFVGRQFDARQVADRITRYIRRLVIRVDEYAETLQPPEWLLREIRRGQRAFGDCDDMATLAAALLLSLGIPARFVVVELSSNRNFKHVFVEFYDGAGWSMADPMLDGAIPPGWVRSMTLEV